MADSGGHWKTLAELQKLTQSTLVPGVVEEEIKRGNPIMRVPLVQGANTGKSIKWLREKTTAEGAVAKLTVGSQLTWSEDIEYTEVEKELKIKALPRRLDKFVQSIYGNVNNYQAQALMEMKKGMLLAMGDSFFYDDTDYGDSKEWDGLHAIAYERGATPGTPADLNIDQANAGLSLANLRKLSDAMKYGIDEIYMPFEIARQIDAAYQEKGFAGLATASAGNLGLVTFGWNEMGKRVMFWDGIPVVRTDFLVAEQADTGTGASGTKRAKYTSGTKNYSIFAVKYGNVMARQPGLALGFGNTDNLGEFWRLDFFEKLEDYDASGIRLVNYSNLLSASTMSVGRIFDIYDTAIVV